MANVVPAAHPTWISQVDGKTIRPERLSGDAAGHIRRGPGDATTLFTKAVQHNDPCSDFPQPLKATSVEAQGPVRIR